jgi:hypothetical protein
MILAYAQRVHDFSYATDEHVLLVALTDRTPASPGSFGILVSRADGA